MADIVVRSAELPRAAHRADSGERPAVFALIALVSLALAAGLAAFAVAELGLPVEIDLVGVTAAVWALAFAGVGVFACAIAIARLWRR